MAQIDDFKAQLIGGGARANQFRVTITPPSGIATGLDVRRASFLCKASSLPAFSIPEIAIPFRGRQIYVAGDRIFDEAWTTTFLNDTDFALRTSLELWSNGINDLAEGTGVTAAADYQTDLTVQQLDRDDTVLKTYIFRSAWPTSIAAIELDSGTADAIEEFECTWRYQHFESSGVNF
jgi:hypothetical protein|tara:strand:- start:1863 stop:2396 length:534 start_codon:yes stop_codon:yes gene_type:complete